MRVSVCLGAILIPEYLDFHSGYSTPRSRITGIYSGIYILIPKYPKRTRPKLNLKTSWASSLQVYPNTIHFNLLQFFLYPCPLVLPNRRKYIKTACTLLWLLCRFFCPDNYTRWKKYVARGLVCCFFNCIIICSFNTGICCISGDSNVSKGAFINSYNLVGHSSLDARSLTYSVVKIGGVWGQFLGVRPRSPALVEIKHYQKQFDQLIVLGAVLASLSKKPVIP